MVNMTNMIRVYTEEGLSITAVGNRLKEYSNKYTIIDYDVIAIKTNGSSYSTSYAIVIRYKIQDLS